jgi:hypothetical protein
MVNDGNSSVSGLLPSTTISPGRQLCHTGDVVPGDTYRIE